MQLNWRRLKAPLLELDSACLVSLQYQLKVVQEWPCR
jgi:hypothetical protein